MEKEGGSYSLVSKHRFLVEERLPGPLLQVLHLADGLTNTFHTLIWALNSVLEPTEYSQPQCVAETRKADCVPVAVGVVGLPLSGTEFQHRSCGQKLLRAPGAVGGRRKWQALRYRDQLTLAIALLGTQDGHQPDVCGHPDVKLSLDCSKSLLAAPHHTFSPTCAVYRPRISVT